MPSDERARGIAVLERWASDNDVDHRAVERVRLGLAADADTRAGAGHLQDPAVLVPGLAAAPWHDPADFPWTAALEREFPAIRAEFESRYLAEGLGTHPEAGELAETGHWSTYYFHNLGERHAEHLARCPTVARVLAEVPGADAAGMCYFSVMAAGTTVRPHCGFVNTRIRCHLGLVVPEACGMRVGQRWRTWTEGRCLVFDDSFEHEVHNSSDRDRAVLLLDTWHPGLTEVERAALAHLLRQWKTHVD